MKATEQEILVGVYRDAFPAAAQLVKRMGGTVEQAKDVFHDALLIYLERKATGTLNVHTSVKAYVLGITKILWLHSRSRYFAALPEEVESFIEEEQGTGEEEKEYVGLPAARRTKMYADAQSILLRWAFAYRKSPAILDLAALVLLRCKNINAFRKYGRRLKK
jgi:DNA-directed RNA polymerase specialized sigma24 family protein